jgi:uncharacterized membrane protein YphA (DoxX/SURF4 family)
VDSYLEVSALVARVLLGLVFVLAGVAKARSPAAFAGSLAQYGILPHRLRPAVVASLPAVETLLGVLLIAGVLTLPAAAVAIALLVAFTAASMVRPNKEAADCGCFGSFGTLNVKNIAARNLVLTALAAVPLATGAPGYSIESAWSAPLGLAVATAVSALLLVIARSSGLTPAMAPRAHTNVIDPGRRSFLGKLAMLSVGAAAVTAVAALRGAPSAEAACYGCGSCGYQYFWIACTGNCCAAFWVAPFEYCEPSCYQCGSWNVQVYCGYPQCC